MYSFGIQNVTSHLLLGNGIGNYAKGMLEVGFDPTYSGASADPHNVFFELAGVFGIVWAVLLILLLIRLMIWNIKRTAGKEYVYYFGLVFITPFVGFASSSCMEKNYVYLALLIPLIVIRFYKERQNKSEFV